MCGYLYQALLTAPDYPEREVVEEDTDDQG